MRVVLLGTGTPNPDPARSGPAVVIRSEDSAYFVDLGPGVVRRAVEAKIRPDQMTRCFVTHLHSDHTVGYPDFIFTPAVVGRTEALRTYGPKGLMSMTNNIVSAYEEDIRERLDGLEPARSEPYRVIVSEIEEGLCFHDDNVAVHAFRVDHGGLEAFGYRFTKDKKTIVISGDTRPSQNLVENARGCDVLIHEVYSVRGLQNRPKEWQEYHRAVHTSSYELGDIASQVRSGLLVLYHQLQWGTSDEDLIAEVAEKYSGTIVSGKDLDSFDLQEDTRD